MPGGAPGLSRPVLRCDIISVNMKFPLLLSLYMLAACGFAADLTGNWVVAQPQNDGTTRRTYFNLKQDGDKITGGIRTGQFYYHVAGTQAARRMVRLACGIDDGRHNRSARRNSR